MRIGHALNVLRAFILLSLGTSIALLLDYLSPVPAFCGGDSGCAQVKASGFGQLALWPGFELPVPAVGIAAFLTLFVLSFALHRPGMRRLFTVLTSIGCALALGFIGLQFMIGSVCSLCMTVDLSMLLIAGLVMRLHSQEPSGLNPVAEFWAPPTWAGLLGLTLLGPLLYPRMVETTAIPATITALYSPSELTVLEFFDFQCPHCRDLSPRLKRLVAEFPAAKLRYGYTPLPGHPGARIAARLCICAAEQGKEAELAERFFAHQDFSEASLMEVAEQVVPARDQLNACLASERAELRIAEDTRAIKEAGFVGLPTTYIGGLRILGASEDRVYLDALQKVQSGKDRSGVPGWLYWLSLLVLAGVVLYYGRRSEPAAK